MQVALYGTAYLDKIAAGDAMIMTNKVVGATGFKVKFATLASQPYRWTANLEAS
jgi:hypothetical protein